MKKIIKYGNVPKGYKTKCFYCDCVFQYEKADTRFIVGMGYDVKCPCCGKEMTHDESSCIPDNEIIVDENKEKWEYTIENYTMQNYYPIIEYLNEMGENGWELIKIFDNTFAEAHGVPSSDYWFKGRFLFKRKR